jgi:hypothetical protein
MANKPVKKNIEKAFDNSSFKNLGLSGETVKEKEVTWIPFKSVHTATGLPGVPEAMQVNLEVFRCW